MTVRAGSADRYRASGLTSLAALAGCVALAARPVLFWPAFAVTVAVGASGAIAPSDEAVSQRTGALGWTAVTLLGVVAFATIRLVALVPPAPFRAGIATVAIGAGIAEELFFRRFVYGFLERRGPALAIAVSALAFALVHIPAYGTRVFPLDLAAGLVLSWQRWASGSWTSSAVSHVAANLMTIL